MMEARRRLTTTALLAGSIALGCAGDSDPGVEAAERPELEVLTDGAPFHGANGIIFDAEDRLHVASVVGREIIVLDRETGMVLERLGPELGVETPDDVAIGPDGSLYWTAIFTGEVGRLTTGREKRGQMVAAGVNPITFSDDGRLFVALDFFGDGLYELDPELTEPPRRILEAPGWLNGMDWGPDRRLYGPIWTRGEVVAVDVETAEMTPVAGGFEIVPAVKFDAQGRLHALDFVRGEVLRIDLDTGDREVIGHVPPAPDNLAFDSEDRLFVSHARDGAIYEVLPDGTTRTVSPGGIMAPGGVALLESGDGTASLFVADFFSLRRFDPESGEVVGVETHFIGRPGGLIAPMTVSADGDRLILSSWVTNAVQVWDPVAGEAVATYTDLTVPLDAVRFQGDLVVAELAAGDGRLVRISSSDPGSRDTLATGLGLPAGLVARGGDLWVSDRAGGRVLRVVADGEILWTPQPVAVGLSAPEGLALTPDGGLLVVETGAGRLSVIEVGTGEARPLLEGLELGLEPPPGAPPVWITSGVAVGSDGTVYLAADRANLIYRIRIGR